MNTKEVEREHETLVKCFCRICSTHSTFKNESQLYEYILYAQKRYVCLFYKLRGGDKLCWFPVVSGQAMTSFTIFMDTLINTRKPKLGLAWLDCQANHCVLCGHLILQKKLTKLENENYLIQFDIYLFHYVIQFVNQNHDTYKNAIGIMIILWLRIDKQPFCCQFLLEK